MNVHLIAAILVSAICYQSVRAEHPREDFFRSQRYADQSIAVVKSVWELVKFDQESLGMSRQDAIRELNKHFAPSNDGDLRTHYRGRLEPDGLAILMIEESPEYEAWIATSYFDDGRSDYQVQFRLKGSSSGATGARAEQSQEMASTHLHASPQQAEVAAKLAEQTLKQTAKQFLPTAREAARLSVTDNAAAERYLDQTIRPRVRRDPTLIDSSFAVDGLCQVCFDYDDTNLAGQICVTARIDGYEDVSVNIWPK